MIKIINGLSTKSTEKTNDFAGKAQMPEVLRGVL
jgi:hypothetical protein